MVRDDGKKWEAPHSPSEVIKHHWPWMTHITKGCYFLLLVCMMDVCAWICVWCMLYACDMCICMWVWYMYVMWVYVCMCDACVWDTCTWVRSIYTQGQSRSQSIFCYSVLSIADRVFQQQKLLGVGWLASGLQRCSRCCLHHAWVAVAQPCQPLQQMPGTGTQILTLAQNMCSYPLCHLPSPSMSSF